MTTHQIQLVQTSWKEVKPIAQQAGEIFYNKLFSVAPHTRHMFKPDISGQAAKLTYMLTYVVNNLDSLDTIIEDVRKLAVRHNKYGAEPGHYAVVGQCLIETLAEGLGANWTNELQDAWINAYTIISDAMIQAQQVAFVQEEVFV